MMNCEDHLFRTNAKMECSNESLARQYGLTGTPSFVLRNGGSAVVVNPASFEDWEVIIDEQLELVPE